MSLALPVALVALALGPWIWWWHRRARPTGDRPFSAFFLVVADAGEGARGARLRAPWLLAIRLISLVFLVVGAAGPVATGPRGTLVLATGPFEADPAWEAPVTVVRAGRPPTLVEAGEVAPVAASPDYGSALLLGRTVAPGARVVRPADRARPVAFTSGAAALGGAGVVVTATLTGDARPVLDVGSEVVPLTRRRDDWVLESADLPAGIALLRAPGAEPWPVCLPDPAPWTVADAGWPPAVQAVLGVLGATPGPAPGADWRTGPPPATGHGWAAFAPRHTTFVFGGAAATEGPAALSFARLHPPPGAVARRWFPLANPAEVLVYAGDAPVVDRAEGPGGVTVRFGFSMEDTDLPATAGWPVLFADLAQADRWRRARCRTHAAGEALVLQATEPVEVLDPVDVRQTAVPVAGRVVLDGLDRQGMYRLISGGIEAAVAVVPRPRAAPVQTPELAAPARPREPTRWPWVALAGLGLLAGVVLGRRLAAPLAWLPVALAGLALVAPRWTGDPGAVVLAVDTSASMPATETAAAVSAALSELPKEIQQIEGAEAVGRLHAGGPPGPFEGGTAHQPLLTAAAGLAGEGGVVVLVTDGRAADGPVAAPVPVVVVPVQAAGPDARVVSARALRLGPQIFVRASLAADQPAVATVRLGPAVVQAAVGVEERTVQAVLPAGAAEVEVAVAVPGDPVALNDRLPVPVEGGEPAQAVVVGAGAVGFAESAGLEARELPAAGLVEAGARLSLARAMFIHDQPAADFTGPVLAGLERWVAGGGVLVLAGHRAAFGPGGWAGTPLDALSPLQADPRPPAGTMAVALALDRSGSMATAAGGIGPEGVARLAAGIAAALRPDDEISVVAFGPDAQPLLAATPVKRLQIEGLQVPTLARGGTRLAPALALAARQLAGSGAQERVLVVISDGQVVDAEAPALQAEGDRLVQAGVRLVAVLTGPDPTREPLATWAQRTGGSLVLAGRGDVERYATASVLGATAEGLFGAGGPVNPRGGWAARVGGQAPPVDHRVRVAARPEARVLAEVAGEPLLAEWAFGQGRVIALATDRWALSPDQWAALLAPAGAPRPAEARLEVEDGLLVFTGEPTDPPPGDLVIVTDARGAHPVAWSPMGPGRAAAPLPPGPVEVVSVATPTARGGLQVRVTRPPPAEVAATGPDRGALALQAAATGGLVAEPGAIGTAVAQVLGRRAGASLAPWWLLLAALALLLDVARWAGFGRRAPR